MLKDLSGSMDDNPNKTDHGPKIAGYTSGEHTSLDEVMTYLKAKWVKTKPEYTGSTVVVITDGGEPVHLPAAELKAFLSKAGIESIGFDPNSVGEGPIDIVLIIRDEEGQKAIRPTSLINLDNFPPRA